MKKQFAAFLLILGAVLIVLGLINSYHMTNAEALVSQWPDWLGSVIFLVTGSLLLREE